MFYKFQKVSYRTGNLVVTVMEGKMGIKKLCGCRK